MKQKLTISKMAGSRETNDMVIIFQLIQKRYSETYKHTASLTYRFDSFNTIY